ncbi:hypothetical protein [Sandaracinus amylolyticus]|uniref:hypothetical protein n=1 Tax=Sandaracinus amylolyticus TaxID=927083 RepID=UPI001F1D3639|nr:hypothetical protein [Sandaracinus amylolyticus]UJR85820.1 Hypothetical protein I5071_79000 [Sandaracinus amylolyticus]
MARAWVLNLDAEHELELGSRYTPSRELRARVRAIGIALTPSLERGDVVIDSDEPALDSASFAPRAWCPTPRALAMLARAGVPIADAPGFETLRAVNERGLAATLAGDELPGCLRATELETIRAHVARPGPSGEWLLKRAFGVAGRGQRPLHPGAISDADRAWIVASLRRGALYVEPRVEITRELSVHAWVARGRVEVRSIREQRVQDRAWVGCELARDLPSEIENALIDTAERVGRALSGARYHGPFGVDSYLWRTSSGAIAVRTLGEINARYCMGWDTRDGWDPP